MSTRSLSEVCIVGGGMLGMTLGLRLVQQGHRVTIIEAGASLGGLASQAPIGDYSWDRFYHVIHQSDTDLLALLSEIRLGDKLTWKPTRTGFYVDGQLRSLSGLLDLLAFPALSLVDKARLLATIFYASRITDGEALEQLTAEEWLEKRSGRQNLDRIWRPLLRAKLGENYKRASASFIWAFIMQLYSARRSGLNEMSGYIDGGYETIVPSLMGKLTRRGVEIVANSPVAKVREGDDTIVVELTNGSSFDFDNVVLTLPCSRIVTICPELGEKDRKRLDGVVYQGVVCASVLLRNPLSKYHMTNICDAELPFNGVVEMTTLIDRKRFGGNSLVYLPRYLAQDDPFWHRHDGEIEEEFVTALERMYPSFKRDDVVAFRVGRMREVMALSTLDYSRDALPPISTTIPNLYIVNSAQILNSTLRVDEAVGLANRSAIALAPALSRARPIAAQ